KEILADIVKIALEELDQDFVGAGSTTFKREDLKRGFEPDTSFYIQNAERVLGKKRLDMEIDPPPDIVIEIDVANNSPDKLSVYSALGVPEVWRYKASLQIWILNAQRYL